MLPGAHHTNQVDNIHLGLEVVNDKLPYLQENGINHLIKATTDSFKSNYSKTIKTYCTFFYEKCTFSILITLDIWTDVLCQCII